ncbi:DUF317 domain-containing protein [Streptomyces sp. NPDC096310]|uniref:DUF317 domain-containing protein n=1 Tax=Streptomyces sp. NPDC096310 TaxID=3366082 RepID=UPI00382A150D
MPVSRRQLDEFADQHLWHVPFDTSPRHLAGAGDARHVTHGLAAAGWTPTSSDPLSPQIVLRSPDRRHSLRFDPHSYSSAWWQLSAEPTDTRSGWYAQFGRLVPAEILGSVTDALHAPPPAEDPDPQQILASAGWLLDDRGVSRSPDGMCRVEPYSADRKEPPEWRIVAHEHGYGQPDGRDIWTGWFYRRTPVHLVNVFVTALVDTAPLQRAGGCTASYGATQERSALTPRQVVDAHTTRLDTLRARARDAQRRRPATTKAPAAPTSTTTPVRR